MVVSTPTAMAFYICAMLFGRYLIVNLIIAVLISTFADTNNEDEEQSSSSE